MLFQASTTERAPANSSSVEGTISRTRLSSDANFLIAHILDIITVLDIKGTILYESPSLLRVLGYTPEELVGRNAFSLIHPADIAKVMPVFMLGVATPGVPHSVRFRFKHKNGTWRSLEAVGMSNHDPVEGIRILVTSRDVTDRSRAEAALGESENKFKAVVESLGEGLLITDKNDRVLYANQRIAEMTGYTNHEMIGRYVYELLRPRDAWSEFLRKRSNWQKAQREQYEAVLYRNDGTSFWTQINATPHLDQDGEIIGTLAAVTDITDRKEAQAALERTNAALELRNLELTREINERKAVEERLRVEKERAEEMSRLKSSFLANMSHEVRTPMTSILGFAEEIADRAESEDLRNFSASIAKSGTRLMDTITSILELARLESNELQLQPSLNRIDLTLDAVAKRHEQAAKEKGLSLYFRNNAGAQLATFDEQYLSLVIKHLVTNAIKFTDHGSIEIILDSIKSDSAAELLITVSDTGLGISKDFLPFIFDEFKQESTGWGRTHEGNGLGLTLSRKIVERMGGVITVNSQKLQGSEFMIRLPVIAKVSRQQTTAAA